MVANQISETTIFTLCHKIDEASHIAEWFFKETVRLHDMPRTIVFDRAPKFLN